MRTYNEGWNDSYEVADNNFTNRFMQIMILLSQATYNCANVICGRYKLEMNIVLYVTLNLDYTQDNYRTNNYWFVLLVSRTQLYV